MEAENLENTENTEYLERKKNILTALQEIEKITKRHNSILSDYEETMICRIQIGDITMLNPGARKMKKTHDEQIYNYLMLNNKLYRRNLFFLRERKRWLEKELAELEATQSDVV